MSEGSKENIGSKDALIKWVKDNTGRTTKAALEHIGCYTYYFYNTQSFGQIPADIDVECIDGRANSNNFWIFRENMRMQGVLDVEYMAPPPRVQNVLAYRSDLRFHFLHMSLDTPGMVAYTPSIAYGISDRQVKTKLGGYLAKFYGDYLTANDIKRLVDGTTNLKVEVLDSSHIVDVYTNGPSSCMGGDEFDSDLDGIHPCKAYETDDWGIAIFREDDKITNRALICLHDKPDGKKGCFVRCYGEDGDALKEKLIEAGYEFVPRWPHGARLRAIECSGGWVAPYLDGSRREVGREGKFFVIGGDGFIFENSSGYIGTVELTECQCCGEEREPGEMEDTVNDGEVCRYCIENSYVSAYYSRGNRTGYVQTDETIYCQSDGEYYVDDSSVLDAHNIAMCTVTGDYHDKGEMVETDEGWVHEDEYVEPKDEDTIELPLEVPATQAEQENREAA